MVKNPPASAGDSRDIGSIPGSGRSRGVGTWKSNPVFLPGGQERGTWWATVHGVAKSQAQLSMHTHTIYL